MIERAFHTLVMFLLPLTTLAACDARAEAAGPAISSVTVVEPASGADVPRYGKLELLVGMTGLTAVRFYDPDPASSGIDLTATFTAPSGSSVTVPGYYDGAAFRVRFAPTATGTWTFSLRVTDPAGTAEWTGGSFVCGSSTLSGFVRIDGRSLRFQDGRSLFAVNRSRKVSSPVSRPSSSVT